MDLFWKALIDRSNGIVKPFWFYVEWNFYEHNTDRYFRTIDEFFPTEKLVWSLCKWDVLDVGCWTWNYFNIMNGNVLWIDFSPDVIQASKNMWNEKTVCRDVLSITESYDTITFFENNLWMLGSVEKTITLLKHIRSILKDNGSVYAIQSKRAWSLDCDIVTLTPHYDWLIGETFEWVNFNPIKLAEISKICGFNFKVISWDEKSYVVELKKSLSLTEKIKNFITKE